MLLGLAFPNSNANTTACDNNPNPVTVQSGIPGSGIDPGEGDSNGNGNGGSTTGNTGQTPPPFTNP